METVTVAVVTHTQIKYLGMNQSTEMENCYNESLETQEKQ